MNYWQLNHDYLGHILKGNYTSETKTLMKGTQTVRATDTKGENRMDIRMNFR